MVTPSVITMLMTSRAATQGRGWGGAGRGEGRERRGEGRGESRAPNDSSEALLRWGAAIPRHTHQET